MIQAKFTLITSNGTKVEVIGELITKDAQVLNKLKQITTNFNEITNINVDVELTEVNKIGMDGRNVTI